MELSRRLGIGRARDSDLEFFSALNVRQGKSICYFILLEPQFLERHLNLRCLLEIQRNIQLDQEDEVLNASLLEACFGLLLEISRISRCKTFVRCQCTEGKTGEMYQALSRHVPLEMLGADAFHQQLSRLLRMGEAKSFRSPSR